MDMLCESCHKLPFKYKCPKCDRKSCSLSCVKQHKTEYGCDGTRSKTSFVPLSEFSDNHLLSDYNFLEDVNRYLECNERDPIRLLNREPKPKYHMSQKLKLEASRREIDFIQLSCAFEKHKANTSRVVKGKGPRHCDVEYLDTNVCEDELLVNVLNKYIHPTSSDPVARHRLETYVMAGLEGVKLFMKAEMSSSCARYYPLDMSKSLGDNLSQKTVVEFPEFHVVLEQCSKQYVHHPSIPDACSSDQEAPVVKDLCVAPSEKHTASLPESSSSLVMLAQSYAECTDSE
ncbi:hypothetical protein EMCRGX_G034525 [Ephydatia muelleri]